MCHKMMEKFQQRLDSSPTNNDRFKSCVYFSNWSVYQRKHFPCQIPVQFYTHIFYAFILIDETTGKLKFSDEWCDLQMQQKTLIPNEQVNGNLQQFYQLKKLNRHLKLIMSIGGWGTDHQFESVISDKIKMNNFINNCCHFVEEYGFDGVDIDWEYPKDNHQGTKFIELLKLLRSNLNNKYILTIAAPAGEGNIKNLHIKEMDQYLLFWNIMCYDFTGEGWSLNTGHQSNLFGFNGDNSLNCSDVINKYISAGVNPQKLVMGMPMYGRIFHGVQLNKIQDEFTKHKESGSIEGETIDYKDIPDNFDIKFDARKVGALAYDSKTKQLISFDNPQSAKIKASFIKLQKLGGGMFWDSAGDKQGNESLIENFINQLGGIQALDKSQNNLLYKESKYLQRS